MVAGKTRKEEWLVWGFAGVLLAASLTVIWVAFLTTSFAERDRALAAQEERVRQTAVSFSSSLGNLLGDGRLALTILSREIAFNSEVNLTANGEFVELIKAVREFSQEGMDVRAVDHDGRLRVLGSKADLPPMVVTDREYFKKQVPYPGVGFFIGRPVLDQATRQWILDLSVAVPPNNARLSVLTVAVGFRRLDSLVADLASEKGQTVSLYRDDGALLYRHPLPEGFPTVNDDSPYQALLNTRTPSGVLPIPGLAAFSMVAKAPLWVVVTRPPSKPLSRWGEGFVNQLVWVSLLTLALGCSALGLIYFLRKLREMRLAQEQLARIDPLTGLLNRRAFLERCDLEQLRNTRHPGTLSLVVLDVDHFKRVNDLYGHPAGDRALKDFASALVRTFRVTDVLARIGGEEFAVLMVETDGPKALEIGERVRAEVAKIALPQGNLTTSIGVAVWDGVESFEAWFAQADRALYRAKESGRNRVEAAS